MAEENTESVTLELNLGPRDNSNNSSEFGSGSHSSVAHLGSWLDRHENRWVRPTVIRRNESWRSWRQDRIPFERGNTATRLTGRRAPQTGPSIVVPEIRPVEISKSSENRSGFSTNDTRDKREDGKNNNDKSGFFYCNICLNLAQEPVVTCCGHLFCWPCIYRWLHHHSSANECPVCKGNVTVRNMIPIYGHGHNTLKSDVDLSMKIPPRPQAQRIENFAGSIRRTCGVGNSLDFGPGMVPIHFQHHPPTTNHIMPITSSEILEVEIISGSYLHSDHMERNQEPAPPFEDRDSVSSIAAVIHSDSQTTDNAIETGSTMSLSTSSSGRRNRASRNPYVDSRGSRVTRITRRRLN